MFKDFLFTSYLSSPVLTAAVGSCQMNGQLVDCSSIPGFGAASGFFIAFFAFFAVLAIYMIVVMWKIFVKAGEPGWASIIPIYNMVILLRIARMPLWMILLYLIPVVSIITSVVTVYRLSKSFGQDVGFTIGLILLSPVFYGMLAFGKYAYSPLPEFTFSIGNPATPSSPVPPTPPSNPSPTSTSSTTV